MSDVAAFSALPEAERTARRRRVRVLVLTGLGLNCEVETATAFSLAGASPEMVHLLDVLDARERRGLERYRIISFVGGFAFGDHLGAGAIFANKIRFRLYDELVAFVERGGMVFGICNGFQTMVRLGMLPGIDGDYRTPRATLAPNDRVGYRDAWVRVKFDPRSPCVWTRGLSTMDLPSRHGEGKFLAESPELARRLEAAGQFAARYVGQDGEPTETWPANPSGSPGGVAGVCDPTGRMFGLMPHPDAYLYGFQHPLWQQRRLAGDACDEGEGLALFRNGVDAAAALD